jgi:hypothetical protein
VRSSLAPRLGRRGAWVRGAAVAGAVLLTAGAVAGCGGGDSSAAGGTTAEATTQATGTVTSATANGAQFVATVTLDDGSTAVTGGYPPGTESVQAEVGDLVTFLLPPASTGKEWQLVNGTAPGTVAELAGQGTATVPGRPDSDSFTYRATATGEGTLKFQEVETNPEGAPEPSLPVNHTLVVGE